MNLLTATLYYGGCVRFTLFPPRVDLHYRTPHLDIRKYSQLVEQLKPGDIILTSPRPGLVSSAFISGKNTHVGVYVGESFDRQLKHGFVHAVHPSVRAEEMHTVLTTYAGVEVWRSELPEEELDLVCKRAKNAVNKNKKYDYNFLSTTNATEDIANLDLYCSELVEFAYRTVLPPTMRFKVDRRLGREFYLPDTFISQGQGFEKVVDIKTKDIT